jgi:ribose 5-phosphate isomerase A
VLADYEGDVDDAARLATRFAATPGVVSHGLFPPELVHEVVVARAGGVERLQRS